MGVKLYKMDYFSRIMYLSQIILKSKKLKKKNIDLILNNLSVSYIYMKNNCLFYFRNHFYELIIYSFMCKINTKERVKLKYNQ